MKRYMDLIRRLLEQMEATELNRPLREPEIAGYTPDQVRYHITLCLQAGYARRISPESNSNVVELTWQGHEALDAFRESD